jgi:hypothetical protein
VTLCPSSLVRSVSLAAVMTVAGLCPATASPSISWSGEQHIILGLGPGDNTTWFDLNGDGIDDVGFRNYEGTLSLIPSFGATATTWSGYDRYRPLDAATMIDASLAPPLLWSTDEDYLVSYMIVDEGEVLGIGPWKDVTEGLLGVSFDAGGNTHYGWLRMSDVSSTAFMLHDWAYETQPGVGIHVGVVPEPGTISLFAIGLGALGWSRWRRKRRA